MSPEPGRGVALRRVDRAVTATLPRHTREEVRGALAEAGGRQRWRERGSVLALAVSLALQLLLLPRRSPAAVRVLLVRVVTAGGAVASLGLLSYRLRVGAWLTHLVSPTERPGDRLLLEAGLALLVAAWVACLAGRVVALRLCAAVGAGSLLAGHLHQNVVDRTFSGGAVNGALAVGALLPLIATAGVRDLPAVRRKGAAVNVTGLAVGVALLGLLSSGGFGFRYTAAAGGVASCAAVAVAAALLISPVRAEPLAVLAACSLPLVAVSVGSAVDSLTGYPWSTTRVWPTPPAWAPVAFLGWAMLRAGASVAVRASRAVPQRPDLVASP